MGDALEEAFEREREGAAEGVALDDEVVVALFRERDRGRDELRVVAMTFRSEGTRASIASVDATGGERV